MKKKVEQLIPEPNVGLTTQQVKERIRAGLVNKTRSVRIKSFTKIFFFDALTILNIILIACSVLFILGGQYFFILPLTLGLIASFICFIKDINIRKSLTKERKKEKKTSIVIRNGQEININPKKIVQDDILLISDGDLLPVDGEIISGSIYVNEQRLTGNVKPVRRGTNENVYSDSVCASGKAYVHVTNVGRNVKTQQVVKSLKKAHHPKTSSSKTLFITGLIICLIALAIVITNVVGGIINKEIIDWNSFVSFFSSLEGELMLILPTSLYFVFVISLLSSSTKLKKKQIRTQDIYSIESFYASNVVCFDKTGTLTEGTMRLKTIVGFDNYSQYQIQQLISNVLAATKDQNETADILRKACPYEATYPASNVIPFSKENKYSAATFGVKGTFVLGEIDYLNIKNKQGYLYRTNEFTVKGNRVLILANSKKPITGETFDEELTVVAILVFEENIRKEAMDFIKELKNQNREIKVISSDGAQTASEIAKSTGIPNAEKYISLSNVSDRNIPDLVENYVVFGDASPKQKAMIIKALQKKKKKVAMVGDSLNDAIALKNADCSIALGSGDEIAKNSADFVLLDSNLTSLSSLLEEGEKSLSNSKRIMPLFLSKSFFGVFIALFFMVFSFFDKNYVYPFNTLHIILWEVITALLAGLLLLVQKGQNQSKLKFAKYVIAQSLIPSGSLALIIICYFVLYLLRINGFVYLGFSNYPYENAFEGATYAYPQFVAMSAVTMNLFSVIILFKMCTPINKHRSIAFFVPSSLMIILLGLEILFSYFEKGENIVLKTGFGYLHPTHWLLIGAFIIIVAALYLYITYLVEILKEGKNNDKSKSRS